MNLILQNPGYNRANLKRGSRGPVRLWVRRTYRKYIRSNGWNSPEKPPLPGRTLMMFVGDQTLRREPLAPIIRKAACP